VLRVVHAEGDPAARGRTIGSELGDLIDRSLGFYREYLAELGVRDLARAVAPYRKAAERSLPEHVKTITAMAAAAGVSEIELFAVNACEELEEGAVPAERCSSFTAVGPGFTLLAHNEQWLAGDAGNVAVVVERPAEDAVVVSPTLAACLPAVGMNGHGGAQGIHSLTARDERVGTPRVLVSRHALEASDRHDAIRRAGLPERAGGYAHLLAFRGGDALTIETSATALAVLEGPGPHTNHYTAPELADVRDEPGAGSVVRLERLAELLEQRPPSTPEEAMEILRDHDSTPQAICKHPGPNDPEESTIVFSMVCELESRRMWVAAGNPCETAYEEIELPL
jgi:Acyl-coenzyme A:6-aminopenicillanic acid acyl-transferase